MQIEERAHFPFREPSVAWVDLEPVDPPPCLASLPYRDRDPPVADRDRDVDLEPIS